MGYKMNGSPAKMGTIKGTSGHASALKHKGSASHMKKYGADHDPNAKPGLHTTKEFRESEKQTSKEQAISAEELNTTEKTCAKCGANIDDHKGKAHAFEIQKPAGPDTKPKE